MTIVYIVTIINNIMYCITEVLKISSKILSDELFYNSIIVIDIIIIINLHACRLCKELEMHNTSTYCLHKINS